MRLWLTEALSGDLGDLGNLGDAATVVVGANKNETFHAELLIPFYDRGSTKRGVIFFYSAFGAVFEIDEDRAVEPNFDEISDRFKHKFSFKNRVVTHEKVSGTKAAMPDA